MLNDPLAPSSLNTSDAAVAEGGAYEVLIRRLKEQGIQLSHQVDALNSRRLEEFGSSSMDVLGRVRIRTENNCVARDIVCIGDCLLFGYNVFIGLKAGRRIEDVFNLYRLACDAESHEAHLLPLADTWLADPVFRKDFEELYTYYRDAQLLELLVHGNKLLASFQVGERITDIRVFRWSINGGGNNIRYIDNRGERDISPMSPYDFDWVPATREMIVNDRQPRISILDSAHVQLEGGDLLLKIEDNTPSGLTLYRESVSEKNQALPDLQIAFARLGNLVLLKILPYKEEQCRYLVCNLITRTALRIDALGQACQRLPEDHGIVFPGGLYLQSGEHRAFELSMQGMLFKRLLRSPNGEDILYIFYDAVAGRSALFSYNTIKRELYTPIFGHGYARLEDGRMVIFSAEAEPSRHHPMQIWQTPFFTEEFAARQIVSHSFLGRIGNADLVRGISDLYDLARETRAQGMSALRFAHISHRIIGLFDKYYWLAHENTTDIASTVRNLAKTSGSIADEFEKVEYLRGLAARSMLDAQQQYTALCSHLERTDCKDILAFVALLDSVTGLRGHVLTIRDQRYVDSSLIDELDAKLEKSFQQVASMAADFMCQAEALQPYLVQIGALDNQIRAALTVFELNQPSRELEGMAADLDLLSTLAGSLNIDDTTRRTQIIDAIAQVYALMNQAVAQARERRKALSCSESISQFAAQFQLLNQDITHALGRAVTPQMCDEQVSRLLVQMDELDARFGVQETFLRDIMRKREEVLEAFEHHKQTLVDARQRQAQALMDAANRILSGTPRRLAAFASLEQLNVFFAADAQLLKLRELCVRLRALDDSVKADDVEAGLKAVRDQALRSQRDKTELFDASGKFLKLGPRHRFSVNTQALDLTLMPRDGHLWLHITGTHFFQRLDEEACPDMRSCFSVSLESESDTLYRSEYLVGQLLDAAAQDTASDLSQMGTAELEQHIRRFCTPLYKEGYENGIHDHDASLILKQLLPCMATTGSLRFSPSVRAFALIAWHFPGTFEEQMNTWPRRARCNSNILRLFSHPDGIADMRKELAVTLERYAEATGFPVTPDAISQSAEYLMAVLVLDEPVFEVSLHGWNIVGLLDQRLDAEGCAHELTDVLRAMEGDLHGQWSLLHHWVTGICQDPRQNLLTHFVPEAIAILMLRLAGAPKPRINTSSLDLRIEGLLGEHPTISNGLLQTTLDDFFTRLHQHRDIFVPRLQRYRSFRQSIIEQERHVLRIDDFQSRPLTSFVRNQLISEVYLPLIADNLAKQIGTAGETRRSDLMGMLMLISPPGYGKTTLIEYIAFQLGMAFVKINGPALGYRVESLDPAQALDGPARMELEKLNLALEMGNNVCLLIDDIQHLSPFFLQKFISLCDGTRRIENVWKGQTRTCDLRGRKFCIVMAGNPYTESGELFQVPDMLVNRADVYNLGEVSGGHEAAFALSYIENCMTSSPVLSAVASRDQRDLYRLLGHERGQPSSRNDPGHDYSPAEVAELTETLRRLMTVRDVLLKVNAAYIASAAQADEYRTEPAFRLQGSYRNMNKLAEKVSAAMNDAEIDQLITDHYRSESQMLMGGSEENLLKLAELRGVLTSSQIARWDQIKTEFMRNKAMGGDEKQVGSRIVAQLNDAVLGIRAIAERPVRSL
ncbi:MULTISPECIES: DNA repair ATPase [Pseudomonas syringae group]|uniref:AAA+ ATPase domain-containing protein n=1 Tax=Pseudomonas syringae pv. ribicola TaxID=55398 RepID=A0A3M2W4R5_PSESI|nr:DNA repair ATPase [Pseudomonas syringae group genomosp. 3]RML46547.1 hypothetical protein ALQ95_00016 [Pseudomonas syringae pv. ribicola]